jgi:hypothetical protein
MESVLLHPTRRCFELLFILKYGTYNLAERVGFEPTCPLLAGKTLSRRPRYDHFGTSPAEPFDLTCWRRADAFTTLISPRRSVSLTLQISG